MKKMTRKEFEGKYCNRCPLKKYEEASRRAGVACDIDKNLTCWWNKYIITGKEKDFWDTRQKFWKIRDCQEEYEREEKRRKDWERIDEIRSGK